MKNHRDVCLAREAGFAEFSGLSGKIKTGCPNTPQPKSPSHTPTAFTPEGDTSSTETAAHTSSSKLDEQLAYKKITRQSTFYQVHYTIIKSHWCWSADANRVKDSWVALQLQGVLNIQLVTLILQKSKKAVEDA